MSWLYLLSLFLILYIQLSQSDNSNTLPFGQNFYETSKTSVYKQNLQQNIVRPLQSSKFVIAKAAILPFDKNVQKRSMECKNFENIISHLRDNWEMPADYLEKRGYLSKRCLTSPSESANRVDMTLNRELSPEAYNLLNGPLLNPLFNNIYEKPLRQYINPANMIRIRKAEDEGNVDENIGNRQAEDENYVGENFIKSIKDKWNSIFKNESDSSTTEPPNSTTPGLPISNSGDNENHENNNTANFVGYDNPYKNVNFNDWLKAIRNEHGRSIPAAQPPKLKNLSKSVLPKNESLKILPTLKPKTNSEIFSKFSKNDFDYLKRLIYCLKNGIKFNNLQLTTKLPTRYENSSTNAPILPVDHNVTHHQHKNSTDVTILKEQIDGSDNLNQTFKYKNDAYTHTKLRFLANLHHPVSEVGHKPYKRLNLSEIEDLIDNSRKLTFISSQNKDNDELYLPTPTSTPENGTEHTTAIYDKWFHFDDDSAVNRLTSNQSSDQNVTSNLTDKFMGKNFSTADFDSGKTITKRSNSNIEYDDLAAPVDVESYYNDYLDSSSNNKVDYKNNYDLTNDDLDAEFLGRRRKHKKRKKKKHRKLFDKHPFSFNDELDGNEKVQLKKLDEKNDDKASFVDFNDIRYRIEPSQQEDIKKFIKDINSPPKRFDFDIDEFMSKKAARLIDHEENRDHEGAATTKPYYEFFIPPYSESENSIPYIATENPNVLVGAEPASQPAAKAKRDILTQRLKSISNKINMFKPLHIPLSQRFEHENVGNIQQNRENENFSNNLDALNFNRYKNSVDNSNEFIYDYGDDSYNFAEPTFNIEDSKETSPNEANRSRTFDLDIDLDLDRKFRDLKFSNNDPFYSHLYSEDDNATVASSNLYDNENSLNYN